MQLYTLCKSGVIAPKEASALDFKDAAVPSFGQSNVVFSIFSNEHQKVPSVKKFLLNGIFYTADINLNHFGLVKKCLKLKGGFPVIAEVTRILAANIRRQFFFVITTTASTHCLVQNFQLICCS